MITQNTVLTLIICINSCTPFIIALRIGIALSIPTILTKCSDKLHFKVKVCLTHIKHDKVIDSLISFKHTNANANLSNTLLYHCQTRERECEREREHTTNIAEHTNASVSANIIKLV